MSQSRRGHGNTYSPTHAHIPPSLGVWRGKCGKCGIELGPSASKKHPAFGFLVCKQGCKK